VSPHIVMRTLAVSTALMLAVGFAQTAFAQTVSVLVAYHSATGNTEKMAQGIAEGVKSFPGANVLVRRVGDHGRRFTVGGRSDYRVAGLLRQHTWSPARA
jgi:hypothetical protein